jgi:hypothetical protein
MEPAQVRSVFSIVRKQSPGDASDLLASMLEEALVSGGKPVRGAVEAERQGVQRLGAQGAIKALEKVEPLLRAAAPDGKAKFAISRIYSNLDRLRHGPNIAGSDTAPKAYGPVMELGRNAVGAVSENAAKLMDHATMLADKITGSNKGIAEALSTRHGLEVVNGALEILIAQQQRKQVTQSALVKMIESAAKAGIVIAPRTAARDAVEYAGNQGDQ